MTFEKLGSVLLPGPGHEKKGSTLLGQFISKTEVKKFVLRVRGAHVFDTAILTLF